MKVESFVLIPQPKKVRMEKGRWHPSAQFKEQVEVYPDKEISLPFETDVQIPPQGYRLRINGEGPTVAASAPEGRFYALMTLRQILRQTDNNGDLPCCTIEDCPDFPIRGFMLDVSRNRVPTVQTLRRLIDLWAELKLNQLQLYTEHTFAYPGHEQVWAEASPISAADIEQLDAYCRRRHIELVANQNSFGHFERWFEHPEYLHLAECKEGVVDFWGNLLPYPTTLAPGPESLAFLEGLYDALLPHFSSDWINVGCDETYELGRGRSRKDSELRGVGAVYLDFLLQIHEAVNKRGKRMVYWADMILEYPELIPRLPPDALAMIWGYEADHPFEKQCRVLADSGIPFGVCPGTSAWNSFGGRWENARQNLLSAAEAGKQYGARSFLITEWGDNGHWQQLPIGWPGTAYGAAVAWGQYENKNLDIASYLSRHVIRDPEGRAARALMLLQSVYLDSGVKVHNATILWAVFHDRHNKDYAEALDRADVRQLERVDKKIRRAQDLLSGACIDTVDGDLLREELLLSAHLMLRANALLRARLEVPDRDIARIPDLICQELAFELRPLLVKFTKLWSSRYRPGGLQRSLRGFQDVLAQLEDRQPV